MSPLGAWIESQQSMPLRLSFREAYVSMGRNKPKLLPNKLVLIREHLGIVPTEMASTLEAARKLKVTSRRLSKYENGESEPTLMEVLVYARSVGVSMESIVDDMISMDAFRRLLGKQNRGTSGRTYNEH